MLCFNTRAVGQHWQWREKCVRFYDSVATHTALKHTAQGNVQAATGLIKRYSSYLVARYWYYILVDLV